MRAFAAILFALLALPAAAQSAPQWRLELGGEVSAVSEVRHRGYAALPVSALLSVGAQLGYGRGEVIARLGGHEVRFRHDSPGVLADGRALAMEGAVYVHDGVTYVPVEFFARVLPEVAPGMVTVDAAARRVRGDPAALATGMVAAPGPAARSAPPASPAPRAPEPARPGMRRLVVIDPGHGGVDPGAVGPGGTREKDVNLQLARRVVEILRADPTLDVRITRNRDTLIALHDRARMANAWRAEGQPALFMSIHCNAHESRSQSGFETYFLAEARTADARRVQAMEDAAMQYEEQPAGRSPLDFIMADLRQNQYLRESSDWAQMIQNRLAQVHAGPNRGVKQAGFAVLVGAYMPSVLVEVGFISNHAEERMLRDGAHQDLLARQLAAGVQDFFQDGERRAASAAAN
jgi:N-acetylmuramoyl-L-alanine amidase